LAQYRIPETLHHDDFHDANVFVRDDRAVFADWGESCVAHPFFTLLVMLRSSAYRLKLADNAPGLLRLRDIYLEQWTSFGSQEDLLAAFQLAQRVAMVCRALTWHHVVSRLAEPFKSEYADTVPGWLQEFLNAQTMAS
jgi:aminoglycoside phosphotransferase (APT) family kinase protein